MIYRANSSSCHYTPSRVCSPVKVGNVQPTSTPRFQVFSAHAEVIHHSLEKELEMSYVASIIIRDAVEKPEDVATQAKNLIASYFSSEKEFPSVRVHVTPIKQRRDLGIVEIDISQSRERERLDLLKKVFMKLCAETNWGMELDWDGIEVVLSGDFEYLRRPRGNADPVAFDPYSDEEQDNPYWERETQLAADD